MVSYEPQIRFRNDLSDEDQEGARQAVAGTAEHLRREADERARIRTERQAARAALAGDREAAPADDELRRTIQANRDALAAKVKPRLPRVTSDAPLTSDLWVISAYDSEWHWTAPGASRASLHSEAKKETGLMHITGSSDVEPGGLVDAACGIGFKVTSDQSAIVKLRPVIPYFWHYLTWVDGSSSYAEAEGGVNLGAWVPPNSFKGSSTRSVRLFRKTCSSPDCMPDPPSFSPVDGSGIVPASEIAIEFLAHAGITYHVTACAWIRCHHTPVTTSVTGPCIGAHGRVEAHVQSVVIERRVLG